MRYWTIELHQTETGSWVGVVKQRPGGQVCYMSDNHYTATFAFTDCLSWMKTAERLATAKAEADAAGNAGGKGHDTEMRLAS